MMRTLFNISIFTCIFSMFIYSADAQDITVVSSSWTPFVYEENGEITGVGTEIVRATLSRAGIRSEINLYPWKRAMKMAEKKKNVMIYPIIRIKEREPLFIWAVPMFKVKMFLYKLKKRTDIVINSLDDARKYSIGVLREAAMHQMLRGQGFEDRKQLKDADSNDQNVSLLFRGRIDLIAENPMVMAYEAKKLDLPVSEAEEVLLLFEHEAYMAFGRQSSGKSVERIRAAFEQIRTDGTAEAVLDKYR